MNAKFDALCTGKKKKDIEKLSFPRLEDFKRDFRSSLNGPFLVLDFLTDFTFLFFPSGFFSPLYYHQLLLVHRPRYTPRVCLRINLFFIILFLLFSIVEKKVVLELSLFPPMTFFIPISVSDSISCHLCNSIKFMNLNIRLVKIL